MERFARNARRLKPRQPPRQKPQQQGQQHRLLVPQGQHAASSAGASSGQAQRLPMDVDDDDSFVVLPEHAGWDPLDLAPRAGETAYQAAVRMQLKGRRHTSYVGKWGDPNSLTAVINRSTNADLLVDRDSAGVTQRDPVAAVHKAKLSPLRWSPSSEIVSSTKWSVWVCRVGEVVIAGGTVPGRAFGGSGGVRLPKPLPNPPPVLMEPTPPPRGLDGPGASYSSSSVS